MLSVIEMIWYDKAELSDIMIIPRPTTFYFSVGRSLEHLMGRSPLPWTVIPTCRHSWGRWSWARPRSTCLDWMSQTPPGLHTAREQFTGEKNALPYNKIWNGHAARILAQLLPLVKVQVSQGSSDYIVILVVNGNFRLILLICSWGNGFKKTIKQSGDLDQQMRYNFISTTP